MSNKRVPNQGRVASWIIVAALFSISIGCSDSASTPSPDSKGAAEVTGAALEALARADAVDGKTDKVVEKCLMCSLGMNGKPEITSTVAGYELHHCKLGCKSGFEENPEQALLMKAPKANVGG